MHPTTPTRRNGPIGRVLHRWGALALLLLALAVATTACAPSGGVSNVGWTEVAATGDTVYAALSSGAVVAIDAQSGTEQWRYPPPTERPGGLGGLFARRDPSAPQPLAAVYGSMAVEGDLLLVTSFDATLYAFDRATGDVAWQYDVGAPIVGGVTVVDGVAYFGANDHRMYALDLATRGLVWPQPYETGNWIWGRPAVDAERVYVGSMDHAVYALDRATGELAWRFEAGGAVAGSVVLSDGLVLVGTVDKQFHALDAATGEPAWVQPLGQWVMGDPLVVGEHAYVTTLDGMVHAFRVADGSTPWEAVSLVRAVRAGPRPLDGALIVATEAGELWRVDPETGATRRLYPDVGEPGSDSGLGAMLSAPAVVGDVVYVGTATGNVLAADATAEIQPELWIYSGAS